MTVLAGSALDTPSLLVVLPAPAGAGAPPPETMIAGLPLLRRIVLAAARAGFQRVLVHPRACPEPRLLEGTGASMLRADSVTGAPGRLVLLPVNVLPQARWLRLLREMPLDPGTPAVDASGTATLEGAEGGVLLRSAGDGALDLIAELGRRPRVVSAGDPAGRFPLVGADGTKAAEAWLLQSLIKDTEGFMSRHVERRISLAITRRLVATSITPNAMTLVSLAVGLLGAPFFLSADPLLQVTSSLLFLTHSILDGCDGELARLKFLESPGGARLDFWGDNLVHVAVFASMAIGWSMAADATWPLLLGALAVTGTAAAAVLVSRRSAAAPTASTARLAEAVANRDFIYLVVLLACFGRAHWFLIPVALGTPIFMLLVRWGARRRRQAA
ncbi:MAG TPA: CDP-alcohol phosphatidyltransferase family protein [Candidatus Dormibacteraeota bacterium]|nr:CDP-alcohol phosphatidyltransferase family protein [Candidatus Dormibacteraeota bacterium]